MNEKTQGSKSSVSSNISTIIGVILCVVFGLLLACNLTIIIKGSINPERPPEVLGVTPLAVLSGSMSGDAEDHIEVGDLIFVGSVDTKDLEKGDVIAFMEGNVVVTHRIVGIKETAGGRTFTTKGDANNTIDQMPVFEEEVVGIYKGRIPKVGDFAIFLQTPVGMIMFVGVPLLAFIIYDIIRRQKYASKEDKKNAELEAELEKLRALAKENNLLDK